MVDQFKRHTIRLKELSIKGDFSLPELDKLNVVELVAAILEAQEEIQMERLILYNLSS